MIPWRKVKKEKLNLKAQNLLFLFLYGEHQEEMYSFKVRKLEKSTLKASWWSFGIPTSQSQLNGYLSFKKLYWQETLSAVPDRGFQAECYPAIRQLQSFGSSIYKLFMLVRSENQVWFMVKALGHVYTVCSTVTKVLIWVFRSKKVT